MMGNRAITVQLVDNSPLRITSNFKDGIFIVTSITQNFGPLLKIRLKSISNQTYLAGLNQFTQFEPMNEAIVGRLMEQEVATEK